MSVLVSSICWQLDLPATQKLVLVSLADQANDQGQCWPSITGLMRRTGLSDRGVQRAITALEQAGLCRRISRPGHSSVFQLPVEYPRPTVTPTPDPRSPRQKCTPDPKSPPPPTVGRGTPDRGSPRTVIEPSVEPSKIKTSPAAARKRALPAAKTGATWDAYRTAYLQRYGVEPVRNATVNSAFARLVGRLGVDEAPAVAAYYVSHNRQLYVAAKHSAVLLLRDAEGIRTDWATAHQTTEQEARQADKTASQGQVWNQLIEEARNGKH